MEWRRVMVLTSEALLEPLVRAYSRDRSRLHEIQHVMEELAKTETGREILPAGWDAVSARSRQPSVQS